MVKAITRLLALDYEVVGSVEDGCAVLEAARRLQPDVIVLDLNLPKMSGLEACRQLTCTNPEIKIIMFTAMTDPDVRDHSLAAGAAAFVSKMAGDGDLLSALKRVCDGSD